jgi:peptidoglycan glycosyltransferase
VNPQIRDLALTALGLLCTLVVATTYWQVWAAGGLADRQDNQIQRVAQFQIDRGWIRAANAQALARNRPRKVGGRTLYFRYYPRGPLAAHLVGYSTQSRFRTGLERSMNDYLTAANAHLSTVLERTKDELTGGTVEGNDLVLALNLRGQQAALDALDGRCGAVVVLEARTGRLLVMASSPSFDPNLVERAFERLQRIKAPCSSASALYNRATNGLYAPGSTFKIVTAAAALESGRWSADSTFVDPGYCEVYGKRVNNFDTTRPFGTVTLRQALQYSINSVFCNIGKELGAKAIIAQAKKFGFYERPPLETPSGERAPSGLYDKGELWEPREDVEVDAGRLAFGQERNLVSPLQMAMVSAAIANDGVVMTPYAVERVVAPDGRTIRRTRPDEYRRAVSRRTARTIADMMRLVVTSGTGRAAAVPGIDMGGKTGTAETGVAGMNQAWFTGFAGRGARRIAFAVVLEEQHGTGGTLAAPVAKQVVQAIMAPASNP